MTDSLVRNLDCSKLSRDEIYRKIQPEAFSPVYHLPIKNWDYSAGLYPLAACWSLAHAQRSLFYLSRWGSTTSVPLSDRVFNTLETIRGSSPFAHASDENVQDYPLKLLPVIEHRESTWILQSNYWLQLQQGFFQEFANGKKILRSFKSDIEFYQTRRFNNFLKNIRYIVGDGSRTPQKNKKTRDEILQSLENFKLPLLLLRPQRTSQHVVLAKRFQRLANGTIEIFVYDSNNPTKDEIVFYNEMDRAFYAPDIVRGLPGVDTPEKAVGVFIVDQEDHEKIGRSLEKHYQSLCLKGSN